jgi:hypothetical protein
MHKNVTHMYISNMLAIKGDRPPEVILEKSLEDEL